MENFIIDITNCDTGEGYIGFACEAKTIFNAITLAVYRFRETLYSKGKDEHIKHLKINIRVKK